MENKLKKKDNDMFAVKMMQLACNCLTASCFCKCTATENVGSDKYDNTANKSAETYDQNQPMSYQIKNGIA